MKPGMSNLFAIPVLQGAVEIADVVPLLKQEILSGKLSESKNGRSNAGEAWRSRMNLHVSGESAAIELLFPRIKDFTSSCMSRLYTEPVAKRMVASYDELWVNVLRRGGYNVAHDHIPYSLSGVLWLDVESDVGASKSTVDGHLEFFAPYPSRAFGMDGSVAVKPRNGLAMMWPSALMHAVHPVACDRERIALAWNVKIDAKEKT